MPYLWKLITVFKLDIHEKACNALYILLCNWV